jgi:diacylglycerol kinase family enzyme
VLGVPDQELLVYDGDGSSRTYRGQYMLCAIGVSGFRTYGHRKPILPQAANVCVIRRVGLRDKLRLKAAVFAGTHLSSPHVLSESAQVLEFSAAGPLPMQADGEARWIAPDRFPVRLTLVPDAVPALRSRH